MIQMLRSRMSVLGQRMLTTFRRADPLAAESAARRARWNAVIAEHKEGQKPTATPAPDAKTM